MNANTANSTKFDRIMKLIDTAPLQRNQQDSTARETPSQSQPPTALHEDAAEIIHFRKGAAKHRTSAFCADHIHSS